MDIQLILKLCLYSYRCSPSVCQFVRDNIGIPIESHRDDEVEIQYFDTRDQVNTIQNDDAIVKLFYQKSNAYLGWTDNWGNTKGLDDFEDVCIVLNPPTLKAYKEGKLNTLASSTANKLYVACTRAKGNVYFVPENMLSVFKR